MTREEAISWLTNEKWKNANNQYKKEWNEAFDMAIEALSKVDTTENPKCLMSHEEAWAEIESDLISRADAIEAIEKQFFGGTVADINRDWQRLHDILNALQSAVCDDCIWHVCNYNKVDWDAPTRTIQRR